MGPKLLITIHSLIITRPYNPPKAYLVGLQVSPSVLVPDHDLVSADGHDSQLGDSGFKSVLSK